MAGSTTQREDFFRGEAVRLPKQRTNEDFVGYVQAAFTAFRNAAARLNPDGYVSQTMLEQRDVLAEACERIVE